MDHLINSIATDSDRERLKRIWQEQSLALGAVQSDLSDSIDRMYDDRDAELESQLEWIRHSGYRNVDIYYKNMLFAVVGGHRLNF